MQFPPDDSFNNHHSRKLWLTMKEFGVCVLLVSFDPVNTCMKHVVLTSFRAETKSWHVMETPRRCYEQRTTPLSIFFPFVLFSCLESKNGAGVRFCQIVLNWLHFDIAKYIKSNDKFEMNETNMLVCPSNRIRHFKPRFKSASMANIRGLVI